MRKPAFCICEIKGANQCLFFAIQIEQCLYFLNPKFQCSSHQLGLCRIWSETLKTCFSRDTAHMGHRNKRNLTIFKEQQNKEHKQNPDQTARILSRLICIFVCRICKSSLSHDEDQLYLSILNKTHMLKL